MSNNELNRFKCALCDKPKTLVKSHILSSFLFKEIGGEEGKRKRYKVFHSDLNKTDYQDQGGATERLLCFDCEQELGQYERYASQVIYGDATKKEMERLNQKNLIEIQNIDYFKFKLFLLSNLWRSSISRHEFFRHINLGKKHNQALKKMIFNQNPGTFNQYGCLIHINLDNGIPFSGIIRPIGRARFKGHNIQRFLIGTFGLDFFISNHNIPKDLSDCFLNEAGCIKLTGIEIKEQKIFQNITSVLLKKNLTK